MSHFTVFVSPSQPDPSADILRASFEQKHLAEIDVLKQACAGEIQVARMELDRAVEISKQKVGSKLVGCFIFLFYVNGSGCICKCRCYRTTNVVKDNVNCVLF